MSTSYKLPEECAACGGTLPENHNKRYGGYKDFCSPECLRSGSSHCKACGKVLPQRSRARRDFCGRACRESHYSRGADNPYQKERYRLTCKRCEKPIIQPKRGGRVFCSRKCGYSYKRETRYGINHTEKWGQYAPETRKVLRELEYAKMPMTAKRLATAIDHEYTLKEGRPSITFGGIQGYGEWSIYICKRCEKEFHCRENSPQSKDYCSYRCQRKTEQGIESGKWWLRGENNPHTKVTWEQVDEIRNIYANGQISCRKLGEKYGLSADGVHAIVSGRNWKPENDPRRKQTSN